ncbi:MAG TPA: phosphatase PAP2 family protein [Steroidobacteraceae bacterium]|nr:phosphatase PAP2 family protein [Steroidobacteraceae bacterium]
MARWYGGYGTPLVTDGLIHHHDGIVGTWGPTVPPAQYLLDQPDQLQYWEPWVRVSVFDHELLSHARVSVHRDLYWPASNRVSATLWHLNAVQNANLGVPIPSVRRVATIRRPRPNQFNAQMAFVQSYADLREDRASEILAQMGPPVAFWSSIVNLHPDRRRWTLEMLEVALRFANWVEMRFKHILACRRPVEYSPQIQPMILTPGHGAFPSGHATEAFMIAYLLWRLIRDAQGADLDWVEQLMRQASRIAINRTIAGVHFPVDSEAGQFLGLTLGQYFYQRCHGMDRGAPMQIQPRRFDGERFPPAQDFDWRRQYNTGAVMGQRPALPYAQAVGGAQNIQGSTHLRWLWGQALGEWQP